MVLKLAQPLRVKNVLRKPEYDTVVFLEKDWEVERLGLAKQLEEIANAERLLIWAKGQSWSGLLQVEAEQDKFKEWYLGRYTIKGQKRDLNVDWEVVWLEERSIYTFLELCSWNDKLGALVVLLRQSVKK